MRWLALLLVLAPVAGWAAPSCPFPGQTERLEVQLYFGQSIKGRGLVSRRAWQAFVADTITAALPDGFTVLEAYGQYRDAQTQAVGREPTELVIVVGADDDAFRGRVASVADAYRRRFEQGSVGIVTRAVCAVF